MTTPYVTVRLTIRSISYSRSRVIATATDTGRRIVAAASNRNHRGSGHGMSTEAMNSTAP